MGKMWTEDMEKQYENFRHSSEAWEVLHEESGFEDVDMKAEMLTDFDGGETHIHLHEE